MQIKNVQIFITCKKKKKHAGQSTDDMLHVSEKARVCFASLYIYLNEYAVGGIST